MADVGEDLRAGLDEVDVVAVPLLRLVALGTVVEPLRREAVLDEPAVLPLEQVELTVDEIAEAALAKLQRSSSYRSM